MKQRVLSPELISWLCTAGSLSGAGAVPLTWLMTVHGSSELMTQLQLETCSVSLSVGDSNRSVLSRASTSRRVPLLRDWRAQCTWPGAISSEIALKRLLVFIYHSLICICTGKRVLKMTADVKACHSLVSHFS